MWLDLFVVGLLLAFALAGGLRGGLAAGLSVLTLVLAYSVAVIAAVYAGPGLAARLGWPEFLAAPAVGAVAFLVSYFSMGLLAHFLTQRERRRRRVPRSFGDRVAGACFGCLRGGLLVLLLSFGAIWLDALRATGRAEFLPALGPSRAAAVTETLVEHGVSAALSDAGSGGRFAARVAARPGDSLAEIEALLDDPRIRTLQEDSLFWTYVESGAVDAAMNRASFFAIARDDALRGRFAALGLVDEASGADPAAFRKAVGEVLREVGPRLRGLRDDPELQRLLQDPEVGRMLQSGDTLGLLGHPGFRGLVARLASR